MNNIYVVTSTGLISSKNLQNPAKMTHHVSVKIESRHAAGRKPTFVNHAQPENPTDG